MKPIYLLLLCLIAAHTLVAQRNYVATSPESATPGSNNTLVGLSAGRSITDAQRNTVLGNEAAGRMKSARDNVYIGYAAAVADSSQGLGESVYIGNRAGFNLKSGNESVLIGANAGANLNTIDASIIIGYNAALSLKGGMSNTLIGTTAGSSYTGVSNMVCIGQSSGTGRIVPNPLTGDNGTYIGFEAGGANGLSNATAIGSRAYVAQSGSLILGSKEVLVGIGNSAPRNRLEITASFPNLSGLRFTNLTSKSPVVTSASKVLSVNNEGDVILTSGTDLTAVLNRLTALEKANVALTKRVAILEGLRSDRKR